MAERLLDAQRVGRRFDRHADTYDRFATVQRAMAERLADAAARLPEPPAEILELGCGTGVLTALLAEAHPQARITAVDLSERMVAHARERVDGASVSFVVADVEELGWPDAAYDLVVSSAVLQWLARPRSTLRELASTLRPGGRMLHATFGPDTFRELYATFREAERAGGAVPRAHGLALAPAGEWRSTLAAAGLVDVRCEAAWTRAEYVSCRGLLRAIKATGASHGSDAPLAAAPLLPDVLGRYDEAYRTTAGGVYATYHLLSLSARRD